MLIYNFFTLRSDKFSFGFGEASVKTVNVLFVMLFMMFVIFMIFTFKHEVNKEFFESKLFFDNQEIVIARYNEDLSWIDESPFNKHPITIYNKGEKLVVNNSNVKNVIDLPNVGRETHTFLYHIIQNYDNLSDVTIFLVGSVKLPHKYERSKKMIEIVEKTNETYISCNQFNIEEHNEFKIDTYLSSDELNKEKNKDDKIKKSEIRPFKKWFEHTFINNEKNECMTFNSIISVSKQNILQKPKLYYENLLNQVNTHHNHETVHYFERSWYAVFYPYKPKYFHDGTLNKTIWLLWFQGWDKAPFLQKEVAHSWEINNPGWKVEYIDMNNLKNYVNDIDYMYDDNKNISLQAKSDIVRLSLLKNHGGVWADSTFLCMQSLDYWVYNAIEPSGIWMYHGNGGGFNKGIASWFIVSVKDSYVMTKWKQACDDFWNKNNKTENYFWMDELFKELYYNDEKFKNSWNKVNYIYCNDFGSSHTFENNDMFKNDEKLKKKLKEDPPYVLKYWSHTNEKLENCHLNKNDDCINSTGYYALQLSKNKI